MTFSVKTFIETALTDPARADELAIELEQHLIDTGLMSKDDILEEIAEVSEGDTSVVVWLNGYDRQIIIDIEGIDKPSKV